MNILVTGGAGFIGSNLVPRLVAAGHVVRVLDSEVLGKRRHLGDFGGEFIRGDIRHTSVLDEALADMETVIHLAADTRVIESIADPKLNFDVNVVGSFQLLEAMRARGTSRLINASTGGAIIGDAEPPVHEDMVPKPISPYGATKLAVEGLCSAYAGSYGFHSISLRFSNVYGPRSYHKGSVVAAFYKRIQQGLPLHVYGDGEQTRDFIFIDDLCDGIEQALALNRAGTFQLGSGAPLSVNDLIAAMTKVVAPHPVVVEHFPSRAGETSRTWCDIARARRDLGFDPSTGIDDGLAATWQWFVASQDGAPWF